MPISIEEENLQAVIKIDGPLTIEEVENLRTEVMTCYDKNAGVIFDAAGVSECDTSGIQLLWSSRKTAALKNKNFSIKNPSESLIMAAERIGIKL